MNSGLLLGVAIAVSVCSYVGSVVWLYERPAFGQVILFLLALLCAFGGILSAHWSSGTGATALGLLDLLSSGLLLGTTVAAMLLGHWYLNTPTMQLAPLYRLVSLMAVAILLRACVSGLGLGLVAAHAESLTTSFWLFVAFRWLSGLAGSLVMAWLTWKTLKIPNTQSATGILYAAVIVVFIGELTSQLLSAEAIYPI